MSRNMPDYCYDDDGQQKAGWPDNHERDDGPDSERYADDKPHYMDDPDLDDGPEDVVYSDAEMLVQAINGIEKAIDRVAFQIDCLQCTMTHQMDKISRIAEIIDARME